MNNIRKTEDWIMIALEDHSDSIADFNDGRYPSSVFHAQQCTEKALKALLSFFGIELIRYSIEILNLLSQFFSSIEIQEMAKLAEEIGKCLKK